MKVRTLIPVNGVVKIAGETFFTQQLAYDPFTNELVIHHPVLHEFRITCNDNLTLEFLDLEVPTYLRQQQINQGWETMTANQFILFLLLTLIAQ